MSHSIFYSRSFSLYILFNILTLWAKIRNHLVILYQKPVCLHYPYRHWTTLLLGQWVDQICVIIIKIAYLSKSDSFKIYPCRNWTLVRPDKTAILYYWIPLGLNLMGKMLLQNIDCFIFEQKSYLLQRSADKNRGWELMMF